MKCVLAVCVLAVIGAAAQAAPGWTALQPASPLDKGVGDIWTDCSKSQDRAKIDEVIIIPDPPKLGKELTITAKFSLSETVTSGSIKVTATYPISIIPINLKLDLCEVAEEAGVKCPLSGTFTASITNNLLLLPGTFKGKIEVTDQSDQELACIELDFKV